MVEFVLCVPLLAMLIAGMFFFGWALRNQQKTKLAARYTAWRDVHNFNAGIDAIHKAWLLYGNPNQQSQREEFIEGYTEDNVTRPTNELIEQQFLGAKSKEVDLPISIDQTDTQSQLAQEPGSEDANALAEQTAAGEFPSQLAGDVSAEFQADMKLWQWLSPTGDTFWARHRHNDVTWRRCNEETKEWCNDIILLWGDEETGRRWRRWQVTTRDAIQDLFLADLDQAIQTLPDEELRKSVENLYLRDW